MSIPLSPEHLAFAAALTPRNAAILLLTDTAGPLGDCAARVEDAPAAYMLARIYRHARTDGHLHGKPIYEADAMFAARVRSTIRSSPDPLAWAEKLCRALGIRWDALAEVDRLWWRGEARRLTTGPDGVSLLTDWSRLRQPARLADLITSVGIAVDFIWQIREAAGGARSGAP